MGVTKEVLGVSETSFVYIKPVILGADCLLVIGEISLICFDCFVCFLFKLYHFPFYNKFKVFAQTITGIHL